MQLAVYYRVRGRNNINRSYRNPNRVIFSLLFGMSEEESTGFGDDGNDADFGL